jgi:hypothetical protein
MITSMFKPDKFSEPLLSPIRFRKSKEDSSFFSDLFEWRLSMRLWELKADWIIYCEYLHCWIKVPKGFIFDGASVPKLFHSLINSTDSLFYGAVVHDFIYRFNQLIICTDEDYGRWTLAFNVTRKKADLLLKEVSIQADDVKFPVSASYFIIKYAGVFAWNRARHRGCKLATPYPPATDLYLRKGK